MESVKKNFIYNSVYQILILLVPLITTPYISRVLSPEGIGIYSYNFSIAYYFSMFTILGLNNYGNRTIAAARDDKMELSRNFISIYIMQLIATVLVTIVYSLYCFYVAKNIIANIFIIYLISSLFDINWFFMGIEKFKLFVVRNTLVNLLSVICIFIFVKKTNDLIAYILIMVLGRLLGLISVLPILKKYIVIVKVNYKDVLKHIKPNLILFIPVLAVSLYKIMDKIMLGIISTQTEVGYFESSEKIIKIPLALITSLGTVMLPRMSNLVSRNETEKAKKTIEKSLYFAIFLSCSCSFGIMSIAKYFVPWFYGEEYLKCILIFQILMPSCIFLAMGNVIRTQYLIPYKNDKIFLNSVILGAVVNLIINFLLIKNFASVGVSIGTLTAEMVVCLYQVFYTRDYINFKRVFKNGIPFFISGILMYAILVKLDMPFHSFFVNMIMSIILGIIIYILFFLLFIHILKIKKREYLE